MQTKSCKLCGINFDITDKVIDYYDKISPTFGGKKYNIPVSQYCNDCIQKQMMCFRNERKLYKSKSALSGKEILSLYSPDKLYTVYSYEEWFSDKWNALNFGQDLNFGQSFFTQFEKLFLTVPKANLFNLNCENSDYNNGLVNSKNAYLNFYGNAIVDSNYTTASYDTNSSNDIWWSAFIENSYEQISCDNIYSSLFCSNCSTCNNVIFCEECINCEECIMCFSLIGKKYFIKNKEYSKEEYFKIKNNFKTGIYSELSKYKKEYRDFVLHFPQRYLHSQSSENSSGDYVFKSKNCNDCFTVVGGEDGYNVFEGGRFLEVFHGSSIYDSKCIFNSSMVAENSYNVFFSYGIGKSRDIYYSILLEGCSNCFGCTGLVNQEYCILNKQYTKEEYNEIVPKIIEHMKKSPLTPFNKGGEEKNSPLYSKGVSERNEEGGLSEWGEFFPSSISPFGYNETVAQEWFPIIPPAPFNKGGDNPADRRVGGFRIFKRSNYESPKPNVAKIIPASKLPDNIVDIPDDILNWAVECEVTKKPFRIIKSELEFYRKHHLPFPRRHPDQRHLDRISLRNPRKLYDRNCDKCKKEMKTTYSPERPEIVYCEECYSKEIY